MPSVARESNAYTNDIVTRVWKDDGRHILSILFTRVPDFDLKAVEFAQFGIVNAKKEGAASLNFGAVETVFIQGKFVWNICCGARDSADECVLQDAMKLAVFGSGNWWDEYYSACLEAYFANNPNEDEQDEAPGTQKPQTGSIKRGGV
jgi:hypothetical protein